ncbi:Uncharacterized conserved protein, DUF305 family [Micromonospora pattaloongensis]|uniref:Uncharacterized conserved protein, DUF305 family n=1 Tax=Micromonospora pattaloongensis TaxID=405436 RepID=A0A1H3T5E6_9ACTN|nr:DUF305 domain-containing protein [Micromonospora pattaloongensis]SDZ45486.1 Uncharacterized conserved protein, DUF305 family [Micromonospora pattaloongensis]
MNSSHRRILVIGAVAAAVLAGGAGAYALTSTSSRPATAPTVEASPTPTSTAPVILPGRPGETATVKRGDEVAPAASPRYNTLDVWYLRMMIPHHTQALQMAALAPDRAADPKVLAVAERIKASQAPEILQMRAWLDARGLTLDDPKGGHDHGTMRGMQSPERMKELAAAKGAAFDRLFIAMMTEHHEGAIEMSTNVLKVGWDITIQELANSVATEQAVEIGRMGALLKP